MKKAKNIIIGILIGLVLALGGLFVARKNGLLEAEDEINSDIVRESLESVKELTTLKYKYTNMASFENQEDFYGFKIPFTLKKFIVSYDGVISAGIDLDQVEIDVDQENKRISLTLPEAKILSHTIDEDSLTIYDEKNSIFNSIEVADFSNFRKNEMAKIENKAKEEGFIEEAGKNTQKIIKDILNINPTIKEEYSIIIK